MKKVKFLTLGLAAVIAFSPIGVIAQEVGVSPAPGKVFSHGATGWVWGIFGCSTGIIVAAVVANWRNKRQLTWNEAATCGLLYWFALQKANPSIDSIAAGSRVKF